VNEYVEALPLAEVLGDLRDSVRYSLTGGGKRIRPVLCLATGEAAGAEPDACLPAAAAIELVHNFSLVHDDLPALDDDALRRGRASTHVEYGEAVAVLAGDALLTEAFRLSLAYDSPLVARELTDATLAMIGGQYLDVTGTASDMQALHRLKTGALFAACVGCALAVAGVPGEEQAPWRGFADEVGLLFQLVDDVLDEDGYALSFGVDGARRLAEEAHDRAEAQLDEIPADTSVLREIADALLVRTS
jgi:geranylgeranyl diphosphate synthase, type II